MYAVAAKPSRKRAAVWREVKRLGALYLHDGVTVLPDTRAAREGLIGLAERVEALDGQATLIWQAQLSPEVGARLRDELARARRAEYAEVESAASALEQHLEREALHRPFGRQELISLASDLGRLERWLDQVAARDYLGDGDGARAAAGVARCRTALKQQTAGATSGA